MTVEPVSSSVILKALDCLAMRSKVTAENIANANSPDYRPLKVSFEAALKAAAALGGDAVSAVQPEVIYAVNERGGTDLRLDLELATATATSGRYGTLAELLNRQLQIDALALAGNR
jgi:flagellar basal-body rod protein FlgB